MNVYFQSLITSIVSYSMCGLKNFKTYEKYAPVDGSTSIMRTDGKRETDLSMFMLA